MNLPPPPLPHEPLGSGDRLLIVFCHLSLFVGLGFILPLIIFLVRREESPWVGAHAKEVLNFHLSIFIYALVFIPLCFVLIGIPLLIALGVFSFVCAIIGAIRGADGEFYRYPLTMRPI